MAKWVKKGELSVSRLLLLSAAFALTGCNLFDFNPSKKKEYQYSYGGGQTSCETHTYVEKQRCQPAPLRDYQGVEQIGSKTAVHVGLGVEKFTGGNIVPYGMNAGGTVNKITYDEAFGTALRATAGVSHDVTDKSHVFIRGFYKHASAKDDGVSIFEAAGGTTVNAQFNDYKSYGAEIGFREYMHDFGTEKALRPYVGASVGMARVNDLNIIGLNGNATTINVNDSDWIPTASAFGGVEMPVADNMAVSLETGLRYEAGRDADAIPLRMSSAWSIPVALRGRLSF